MSIRNQENDRILEECFNQTFRYKSDKNGNRTVKENYIRKFSGEFPGVVCDLIK